MVNELTIEQIAKDINSQAQKYEIGKLQNIRKKIFNLFRPKTHQIFSKQTISQSYAFHSGGRHELQFNIGFEEDYLRYGVAFSFELSRSLTSLKGFEPKVLRFNEFIQSIQFDRNDFKMWVWEDGSQRKYYPVSSITKTMFKESNFIFLGAKTKKTKYSVKDILEVFDQLLPLYKYVESKITLNDTLEKSDNEVSGESDFIMNGFGKNRKEIAQGTRKACLFDIQLRHNLIQEVTCSVLSQENGYENVSDECLTPFGTRIDIVKKDASEYSLYEIKTASTLKYCIREAMGQLLEYAYWANANYRVEEMIIIAEHKMTEDGKAYLEKLRKTYRLPIYYQQCLVENESLSQKY